MSSDVPIDSPLSPKSFPCHDPTSKCQVPLLLFIKAMIDEMAALHSNDAWDLVPLPPNKTIVSCRYVFKSKFVPTTLTLDSGVTRPPALISEADLLNCMDKAGIGTDATMHDHIKKLLDRFYATKDSNTRFSPTNLGEALVMGYDDMGYELWKPNLRAMMESDMKAVSIGMKSKAEVLATCLEQMKACFLDARLNKVKLFEAMSVFFERCSRSVANDQHALGDIVRHCAVCHESDMALKRKPDGNFMVGCSGFPQCRNVIWLPGSIAEAAVTTNICSTCTPGPVFLIQFKFRQLEIPPNYNVDHLGCIGGCDEILKQLIEICGTGPRNLSNMPARGQGTTSSSSSTQRTNLRQIACAHCRQYGHSTNDCPTQASFSSRARSQGMNQQTGRFSVSCDTCGVSCMLRTANTANNRGRRFYSCQSQGCNFFVWEDNMNNSSEGRGVSCPNTSNPSSLSNSNSTRLSRGRGRGRGRSRGSGGQIGHASADMTFVSATGDPPIPMPLSGTGRCFVCGDPSHFANACPNRGI